MALLSRSNIKMPTPSTYTISHLILLFYTRLIIAIKVANCNLDHCSSPRRKYVNCSDDYFVTRLVNVPNLIFDNNLLL